MLRILDENEERTSKRAFLSALKASARYPSIDPSRAGRSRTRSAFIGSMNEKLLAAPLVIEECSLLVAPSSGSGSGGAAANVAFAVLERIPVASEHYPFGMGQSTVTLRLGQNALLGHLVLFLSRLNFIFAGAIFSARGSLARGREQELSLLITERGQPINCAAFIVRDQQ